MIVLTVVALFVALASGEGEMGPGPKPGDDFNYKMIPGFGYYKAVETAVKWHTARRVCAKHGGHLLILNSREEALAVLSWFPSKGFKWLGFDDYTNYNDFVTLHGTTLVEAGFSTWAPKEPSNPKANRTRDFKERSRFNTCGALTADGFLAVKRCTDSLSYICEKMSPLESAEAAQRPAWLPRGYRAVGGLGYYCVHRDLVPWETARRRCEAEGAHLMVPNTPQEAAVIEMLVGGTNQFFWLGFDNYDGAYVNFDGEKIGERGVYSKWYASEPRYACGAGYSNGELGTLEYDRLLGYICELYNPGEKSRFNRPMASSPPSGYKRIGHNYYKMYRKEMYWESARRACEVEGTHLLVLNSKSEADAVLKDPDMQINVNNQLIYIGFDGFNNLNEFVWFDGNHLADTYMDWHTIEPTIGSLCGCVYNNASLGSCIGLYILPYICEWEKTRSQKVYANGYRKVEGFGFYKVHYELAAWETARRRCESEGAHLLVINSRDEALKVVEPSRLGSWIWIGFDDLDTEGQFRTLLNTTLKEAGYEQWNEGEPEKGLNCGAIKVNLKLGTVGCEDLLPYICELKKNSYLPFIN